MFKFEDESNTEQQSVQVTKIVDLSEQSLDKRSLLKWGIPVSYTHLTLPTKA